MKKNNLQIIIFLFASTILMADESCKKEEVKFLFNGKIVEKNEVLCLNLRRQQLQASSVNCELILSPKCPFSGIRKIVDFKAFIKPQGSPAFNLCHQLKGSPQLFEVKVEGEWQPFARCFWENSSEFVDLDELVAFYRSL